MSTNGRTPINEVDALAPKNHVIANSLMIGKKEGLRTVDILQGVVVNMHEYMVEMQREMNDAKLILAAVAHQEGGEYLIGNAHIVATPREIQFEKDPPGKDGIVIKVKK